MSRIRVTALVALSTLALPASNAFAQAIFGPGMTPMPARSNPGGAHERDVPTCQASGGGTRMRSNCDVDQTTTARMEHELNVSVKVPALPSTQCGATTTTEYQQRNTIARVNSALQIADCKVASGAFTIALRIKDESGEIKPLEFNETWQRSDDQDVQFTADYPIGENVELVSVRVRGLRCTCADPAIAETDPTIAETGPAIAETE
jgi:hypothetical protein